MSRYARQMILPEVGLAGQSRLAAARILVVGAGGLAAPVLPLLAGAGVGHITMIDGDEVTLSNLHRQALFAETDCGHMKVDVAAKRCRALNSEIIVETVAQRLTPANASALLANVDLVLDCADSYAVSYLLSDLCYANDIPLISASVLGLGGYVGGFCGGAPSLRAVFPEAPDSGASCETAGVLGPVVAMIGAQQAQMALNVLLELDPSPLGQVVQIDCRSFRSTSFRFDLAPEPATAFPFVAASDLQDCDHIIELRSDAALLHPTARYASAEALEQDLPDPASRLVLCCATGLRAWRAAEKIHDIWPGKIVLVAASAS
ncbi:HesA/MoeB/ThiF family protein [Tritonibacter mobilis]|uniref:HesA/MoeB/ThiF family protein n=1 Tax=Tritonibacter mobilis TaxID=379347 RepID=UPI001CD9AAC6|nr:ThiF family adenylyltransferase [Tritonibacter mobilis]MCA2009583.1 ThiF family adenylyltransferase [Tritonibacter mobilis]